MSASRDGSDLVTLRRHCRSHPGQEKARIRQRRHVQCVVWKAAFEQFRRTVLGAGMIGVKGRVQREGEVVHVIARDLIDLSAELASVGSRDAQFPLPHGRGDEFHHGSPTPDPRGLPKGPRQQLRAY